MRPVFYYCTLQLPGVLASFFVGNENETLQFDEGTVLTTGHDYVLVNRSYRTVYILCRTHLGIETGSDL
jgi:hypothetical protein